MDFILKPVTGPGTDEALGFEGPLDEAHQKVRDLWGKPFHASCGTDPEANSRLSWKKGDKVVVYRWDQEDIMVLAPMECFPSHDLP
jgi:hypothetical protein